MAFLVTRVSLHLCLGLEKIILEDWNIGIE